MTMFQGTAMLSSTVCNHLSVNTM